MKVTLDFHRRPALGGSGSDWAITAGSFSDDLNLGLIHTTVCLCFALMDGRGVTSESQKSFALQVQTRCMRETVATHELSHLKEDGGGASGRTCQSPVSVHERFKDYTFGGDVLKEGGAGQSDSAQPVTTPLLHGLHHMFQSMQACV